MTIIFQLQSISLTLATLIVDHMKIRFRITFAFPQQFARFELFEIDDLQSMDFHCFSWIHFSQWNSNRSTREKSQILHQELFGLNQSQFNLMVCSTLGSLLRCELDDELTASDRLVIWQTPVDLHAEPHSICVGCCIDRKSVSDLLASCAKMHTSSQKCWTCQSQCVHTAESSGITDNWCGSITMWNVWSQSVQIHTDRTIDSVLNC